MLLPSFYVGRVIKKPNDLAGISDLNTIYRTGTNQFSYVVDALSNLGHVAGAVVQHPSRDVLKVCITSNSVSNFLVPSNKGFTKPVHFLNLRQSPHVFNLTCGDVKDTLYASRYLSHGVLRLSKQNVIASLQSLVVLQFQLTHQFLILDSIHIVRHTTDTIVGVYSLCCV